MARLDDGRTGVWNRVRKRVMKRDHWTCQMCGAKATQVDHITPRAMGGGDDWGNLQALCTRCHKRKSAQDYQRIRRIVQTAMSGGVVVVKHPDAGVVGGVELEGGGGAEGGAVLRSGSKRGGPFHTYPSPPASREGSGPNSSTSQELPGGEVKRSPFQS